MQEKIHIGEQIRKLLAKEGRSITWLAAKLNYERANIYKLLDRQSIDTDLLSRISIVLEHDFFACYSKYVQDKM